MLIRDYFTSALCGLAWHGLVSAAVFWDRLSLGSLDQLLPGAPAGMLAGIVAGVLTIRSRRRHYGREQPLDLCLDYPVAVAVYAVGRAVTECLLGGGNSLFDLFLFWLFYSFYVAVLGAVVLLPLSFVTRRFVWQVHRTGAAQLGAAADVASRRG